MFKAILFFILFLFLLGSLFGFSITRMLFKPFSGSGSKSKNFSSGKQKTAQTNQQTKNSNSKKIFTKEEGEYVDYEEVKE